MTKRLFAEFFGTFWLILASCGGALFASQIAPSSNGQLGILILGVALIFGLSVMSMIYAVGHISGGHFNPAVSLGLALTGRMPKKELIPYIIAQCIGGIAAAGVLFYINGGIGSTAPGAFASNFYDAPVYFGKSYGVGKAFVAEFVFTLFFVFIIMGATAKKANQKFAGLAIGAALAIANLVCIPITNASINPARALSQAVFVGGTAMNQLWLFWVAPLAGGLIGALLYKYLLEKKETEEA